MAVLACEQLVIADLGTVIGADTGFMISHNPDTVRSADVSFNPGGTSKTFREDMILEGGEVLPGFSLPVREVFKRLRKAPTPTAPPSTESKSE